jgi:membrane-bound serine protease (ClpP class)
MKKKGETSLFKAWLVVLVSLIDDAIVLGLVFLGLWYFNVKITWVLVLIIALVMVVFVFIMHKAVVPALRRRKVTGIEGMVGMLGRVTEPLHPVGTVKVKGEYWKARSVEGNIAASEEVEVVGIAGLNLEVKKKVP